MQVSVIFASPPPPPIGKARRPRFFNSAVVSVVRWRALIVVTRARTTYTNPRSTTTRVFKSGICVPIVRRHHRLRCDPNRRGDIHIHCQGTSFIFLDIFQVRCSRQAIFVVMTENCRSTVIVSGNFFRFC